MQTKYSFRISDYRLLFTHRAIIYKLQDSRLSQRCCCVVTLCRRTSCYRRFDRPYWFLDCFTMNIKAVCSETLESTQQKTQRHVQKTSFLTLLVARLYDRKYMSRD